MLGLAWRGVQGMPNALLLLAFRAQLQGPPRRLLVARKEKALDGKASPLPQSDHHADTHWPLFRDF